MVEYAESLDGATADDLNGVFVGRRNAPSPKQHLAALRGSAHAVLARDGAQIVGFVTALSDCCDAELEPFYKRFGMVVLDRGMGLRR
jgi:hypothetical protein